ncbi:hypothetical protein J4216_01970 [Candidatus Woesearchaeota archaeon]|nr:hypothetical protein [Candidatus Woesearchaeota archaeon]
MTNLEKLTFGLKRHIVDTIGMLTFTNPVYGTIEIVSGMSNEVARGVRYAVATTCFLGLGYLVSAGRRISRRIFNIKEDSSERLQSFHDVAYMSALNIILNPALYALGGETDPEKIVISTGISTIVGAFTGPFIGYSIDLYEDLTGIQKCERPSYPNLLRDMKLRNKKFLAVGVTAASLSLLSGVYSLNSYFRPEQTQVLQLETKKSSLESKIIED